jgi:hypothetical protein
MTHKLLALYGLKWNPVTADVPVDALWMPPSKMRVTSSFCIQWGKRQGVFHSDGSIGKPRFDQIVRVKTPRVGAVGEPSAWLQATLLPRGVRAGLARTPRRVVLTTSGSPPS